MIKVHEAKATSFTSPIGTINNVIKCQVTEELNGEFFLTLQCVEEEFSGNLLKVNNIITTTANNIYVEQAFRIYEVQKHKRHLYTVNAYHITYDLSGYAVTPFQASNAKQALTRLKSYAVKPYDFTFTTDITTGAVFEVDEPSSVFSWFGGKEGSLIDIYGGEWEFDNFTCRLLKKRGRNKYVYKYEGHDIEEFTETQNVENYYTGIMAFWKSIDSNNVTQIVTSDVIERTGDYTRIYVLDASDTYETKPTKAKLNNLATKYMRNNLNAVETTVVKKILFEENFENIALGDTITIFLKNKQVVSRVVKTVWNALLDRYDDVVVGDVKANLSASISKAVTSESAKVKKPIKYLPLDGGNITGDLNVNGNAVLNVGNYTTYAVPYIREARDIDFGNVEIPLNGFITSSSKEIRFFIPWAKACAGTYTMKELSITVRLASGGYPWARSGSSGGTYTRLGDGAVQIWNNGRTVRTNEVSSITVTPSDGAGLRVNITFAEALAPSNGSTAAVTNNVPISISKRSMVVTRS